MTVQEALEVMGDQELVHIRREDDGGGIVLAPAGRIKKQGPQCLAGRVKSLYAERVSIFRYHYAITIEIEEAIT